MFTRRAVLLGALLACRTGDPTPLDRGVAWLLARQHADGAFRSDTYGFLAGGPTTTALATLALAGARGVPDSALSRALGFLVAVRDGSGALGLGGEYPVYATSMAVRALARLHPPGWQDAARPMVRWLTAQQLRGEGWGVHPGRGGFPMGAATPRTPPDSGHVDLSMTRQALQALRAAGADDAVFAEGRAFALRCRGPDGGFRYSPVEPGVNKGATPEASYGTATADGVLALRATGLADDAVADGVRWLERHLRADENPAVGGAFGAYGPAMRFYWRAAAAEALGAGAPAAWARSVRDALATEQRADGSWRNERAEQKEDDPLVATCLALLAWRSAPG